jgi:hypothetical protein
MADPHALTMSRNGTRSRRESVCLPSPNPTLGCPRLPPSGVHTGTARGDHHLSCRPGFALGLTCSQGKDAATQGGQCGADSGRSTPFGAGLVTCD